MQIAFTDTRLGMPKPVKMQFAHYVEGGAPAIELICADEDDFGEHWLTATVNVPGIPQGCVAVKNYSEGEGLPELLRSAGVIEGEPLKHIASGYVSIPVFRLTTGALQALEEARAG